MLINLSFAIGDRVVYPAHGVGKIQGIETQKIGEHEIKVFVISFDDDRMKLRIPLTRAKSSGLRALSSMTTIQNALKTLSGKAKSRAGMWNRRAQEYETKINSGNPVSIAEVIRDLHRSDNKAEQSYSERQIYQSALNRLTRELAAVEKIGEEQAAVRLQNNLAAA